MSLALYPTRLYCDSSRGGGVARRDGITLALDYVPSLLGQRLVQIDYAPKVVAQLMPFGEKMRDMTPDEVRAADTLLLKLCV